MSGDSAAEPVAFQGAVRFDIDVKRVGVAHKVASSVSVPAFAMRSRSASKRWGCARNRLG